MVQSSPTYRTEPSERTEFRPRGQRRDRDTLSLGERTFARLAWERRGIYRWIYRAELKPVASDFEPSLGFLERRDFASAAASRMYGVSMPASSRLLRRAAAIQWERASPLRR